jgi:hypothetical protein
MSEKDLNEKAAEQTETNEDQVLSQDLSDSDLEEVPGGANNVCGFGCPEH